MYCKKCGKKLGDGDKFCSVCGTPVEEQKRDSVFENIADMGVREEAPARKPFHMDEMKWDLDGFPADEAPVTDDIDFNWSSVLEERDNHIYRGYEGRPSAADESGIFDDFESRSGDKEGAFDWGLGATMRIDRPSDVIKREKEAALRAKEEALKGEEESAVDESGKAGAEEAEAPATEAPATGAAAEEEDRVPDLEELTGDTTEGSSRKIDKFYTFNKKNEEFQALLDQEYERLRQRIREESDAEASFKEKYEKLQKARDDWSREEIRSSVSGDRRAAAGAGATAGAAIGGVMAAVDRFKNRPNKADDEVDGLDDYVINELFEDAEKKDVEKKEESSPAPEEKPEKAAETQAETEAAEPAETETEAESAESKPEEEKPAAETTEKAEAAETAGETEAETSSEAGEKAEAAPEEKIAEKAEEKPAEVKEMAEAAEKDASTETEDRKTAGEPEKPASEPETCPPSDEKKESGDKTSEEEKAAEKADKGADKSKVADIALFDDGDEPDEENASEHKKGRALNVIIAILAVIVVVNLVMVGILMFAEDSTAAKCINDGYSKIISFFTGDSEEPADEPEPASEETELTGTAALVEAEKDRARSIGTVEAAADLTIPSGMEERISGLDGSETFVDMAWYTDDEGATVNYGNAVVGQVLEYYSGLVDSKNEESGEESVTYGINTLRIGEIRQNGVDFYVMVETEEVTSDSSDVTKGEYVVHLVAEDKKVTVSEVVDVLEEN